MKATATCHPAIDDWFAVSITPNWIERIAGRTDEVRFVVRLLGINGGHEYVYDATGRPVSAEVRAACEAAERRRVA